MYGAMMYGAMMYGAMMYGAMMYGAMFELILSGSTLYLLPPCMTSRTCPERSQRKSEGLVRAKSEQVSVPSNPGFEPVHTTRGKQTILLLGLETTDIIRTYGEKQEKSFMQYVLPKKPIHWKATKVNKIQMLFASGQPVEAVSVREMFRKFLGWLSENDMSSVVLVAHSGRTFHFPILIRVLNGIDMTSAICARVTKFADSLPLIRDRFPTLGSHSLENLAHDVLGSNYDPSNSRKKLEQLSQVMTKKINSTDIMNYSFNYPEDFEKELKLSSAFRGVCSQRFIKRITNFDLQLNQLRQTFEIGGEEDLRLLLAKTKQEGLGDKDKELDKNLPKVVKYLENIL
ncbi:hypothetical protein CAPTEDRAFT_185766 [Capitella teleta]|uniref:Exonuclease domain-containing protein n=1 Tax=Capitella teleta TaxID=283909 RepID=R7VI51_CAPTE|nr:hypothetical protein CAPTEDRAFT_185766 [Capitella teleta]|eukprot:ELU18284.1 hypothetical protein CAPTEDRAFT_185766 [Capitella teleta]